ncbi:YibE/F family protein [Candidatus Nomurabacteria bacterium]|nr:YibE/F family protein [Candidatus Nomurabacteria bacterium]
MKRKLIFLFLFFLLLITATPLYAQEDKINIQSAKVLEIVKEEKSVILQKIGEGVDVLNQTIYAEIVDGVEKGKKVILENDVLKLKKGDLFFIEKTSLSDEPDQYIAIEKDRQFPIAVLLIIFAVAIIIFGGKQGVRSLISLLGGFLVIIYFLLPMLTKGYSPILVSISFASMILFIAIYFTHGFNRESSVAFVGTIIAVVLTGLLAYFSVLVMQLTGFNTEETMFLDMGNAVKLNFHGLLLGGILIGVLGILDDIAVTQSAVVSEIYNSAGHLSRKDVYKKAMRVGREHVSALVNTLVLAYAGASLPLLLLFSNYDYPFRLVVSGELFATEIVRTIVGSIGLVLTVPITTLLAVYLLKGYKGKSALGHHH